MTLNQIITNVNNSELAQKTKDVEIKLKSGTKTIKGSYPSLKLTAKRQKEIFGYNIFGRKTIKLNNNGLDIFLNHQWEKTVSWNDVKVMVNSKTKI